MRQTRYSFSLFVNIIIIAVFHFLQAADLPIIIEAEYGQYTDYKLLSDNKASNGQYLEMKSSGSAKWEFQIPKDGWYNLKIRYRSPQGEKENTIIKNGITLRTGFGWTENWTNLERPLILKKGVNIIELLPKWGNIDIDCISIENVALIPEVTPHKNIFYSSFPRDIILKLKTYGREIESLTITGQPLLFSKEKYEYEEDTWMLCIKAESLVGLKSGEQTIQIHYNFGESTSFILEVFEKREPAQMTIIAPDISHGNAVLILLPNGEIMLVDCAQAYYRDAVLIPLLEKNGIDRIDYFILTHYHEDHDGGDKGQTILNKFKVEHFRDYRNFMAGDEMEIGGAQFKVLNAFSDGTDENTRSLAFRMEYNGFVYQHDADIYAKNQQQIMEKYPDNVRANVYSANHHFHGSTDENYLRLMQPDLVFIQAEQAIYARSAYMEKYLKQSVNWLKENKNKIVENLPMIEVGTAVIRVNSSDDWSYETYKDCNVPFIPFLPQNKNLAEKQMQGPEALEALQNRIENYRQIISDELKISPKSGDRLSATFYLQLENLERASENPADNANDIKRTEKELAELINWVREGKDYFHEKRGRIKIGYLSEIDSTFQPFDLMIPNQYDENKQYGLLIYLHGKEDPIQKYRNLLWADEDPGLDAMNVFKVAIYGRRNCYYQGAGEADVLRVIAEIRQNYPIDNSRIFLMGASMGGFGSWYYGLNYTDQFAAISPICGRTITGKDFYSQTVNPSSYVVNALHLPVRFYHGDTDPVVPVEESRVMVQQLDSLHYDYIYTEFPGVKHDSWKNARADKERIPWLIKYSLDAYPDTIVKKCFYLKHGKAYWMEITSKRTWNDFAVIKAFISDENMIQVKTKNIDEFKIGDLPIQGDKLQINIDGKELTVANKSGWTSFFLNDNNIWQIGEKSVSGLYKHKGLEGPWLDAEMKPFILVYGTMGKDGGAKLKEIGQQLQKYYSEYDMAPFLISDQDLNDQFILKYNLHLLGGSEENEYLKEIQDQLPVKISNKKFVLGAKYSQKLYGLRMIYPNPQNPDRYIRIDLFPDNFDNIDIFKETVDDFLIYSGKKVEKKGFFNSSWSLDK